MAESKTLFGRRLLPTHLAELARSHPNRPMYTIPLDRKTYAKGLRTITYKTFGQMVDRLAWFLEDKLGKPKSIETLAYVGPSDLRYFILLTAINKVGYKALFPSPRNSLSNDLHLLDKTSCSIFLKASVTNIDHIVESSPNPLHVVDIPDFEDLLAEDNVPEYPFNRSFEEAKNDPSLILHSSGSTGQVKPIVWTYRSMAAVDCHHLLKDDTGRSTVPASLPEGSLFLAMPFFHAAAVLMGYLSAIWLDVPITIFPPDASVSAVGVMDSIKLSKPQMAMLAPSTIEEASQSKDMLQVLETLQLLIYGGGGINERDGEVVVQHVNLQNYIGTTEAGAYPVYPHTDYKNDHAYFKFKPGESGIEFRHRIDDLYELIFVHHDGAPYEFTWDTFPNKAEYATSDLYRPHPTKPGYWKHAGRADDVIVLSNGEKVVPSSTERTLGQAPGVRVALLYGQKRFEIAALVELEPSVENSTREELMDMLEPYLKEANSEAPSHARLSKDHVIFSKPEKPFVRLPKGSVVRKATLDLYEMEIDEVYNGNGAIQISETPLLKGVSEDDTVALLTSLISKISELDELSAEQDFLQVGVDSLKIITIVRLIRAQLKGEGAEVAVDQVGTALVYSNPTVKSLASALRNLGSKLGTEEQAEKHVESMKEILEKYTNDLPTAKSVAPQQATDMSVILTGSTGSLGSYLLDSLLADTRVVRVFSLNRSADGRKKQEQSSRSRGLSTNWDDRVHFLHADLSKPLLGLEQELYDRMVETTTHIIHNQWPVNFNIPLSTFEPHIRGVRNLIDLAAAAPNQPSILFTSSVGVVTNWAAYNPGVRAPEAEIADFRIPVGTGYAESKFVGEELLVAAAKHSGVRSLVVRVGQLAGSVDKGSVWNRDEWFPSIVASSQHLGVLPSSLGPMSNVEFVPVDRGADILLDLAMGEQVAAGTSNEAYFFNMVNPHPVSYAALVPALVTALDPQPRVVLLDEWVTELKRSSESPEVDLAKNPAVKLLDFYQKMAAGTQSSNEDVVKSSDTSRTEEWSRHMKQLEAVKPEWMAAWVKGLGV